jgi:uncharacterized integral membrane protein (TIGR00698 family)
LKRLIPGLLLIVLVSVAATVIADQAGSALLRLQGFDPAAAKGSPISPVTVAILLGLVVAAIIGPRPSLRPGLDFGVKRLLRIGIVLVGIRLSLVDVLQLGAYGIPFVALIVIFAILLATFVAKKLGVSTKFGLLTAAATSICGVTAALATGPAIQAEDREVAYAVANTTLFGMIAMIFYPWLAHAVFETRSVGAGMFLGTSIHDTSQVVGAALAYKQMFADELAFKAATVTKLTRNLFIVAVVPLMGWLARNESAGRGAAVVRIRGLVPAFILGFLVMAVVRTLGDATLASLGAAFALIPEASWQQLTTVLGSSLAGWLLTAAMASVGLSTNLGMFRQLGLRPLWVGAIVAIGVGALGLGLAILVSPLISL